MNSNRFSTSRFFFFAIAVLFFSTTSAQTTISPYSRYGIGDIGGKGFAQGFALGGTHIALQNDTLPMFFVNNGNPAALSNMRLTTAELGANYSRVQLESATNKQTVNSASLGYISLAFPFKKWWGASVGLVPFSSVGYKVSDVQSISNVGDVNFLYEGSGGINQVYFGNGIRPFYNAPRRFMLSSKYARLASMKNADGTAKDCRVLYHDNNKIRKSLNRKKLLSSFSAGANVSYLFGNMENTRRSIFPSSIYAFNTRTGTSTRVDGLYFDYGMQLAYSVDSVRSKNWVTDTIRDPSTGAISLKKQPDTCHPYVFRKLDDKVKFLFGVTFATETKMEATIDSLSYSYFNNSLGYEIVKDTIENVQGTHGNITLPLSLGFGVGFRKGDKWLVAADFAIQNWSTYQAFGQTQDLRNSMRTSLGVQWVPNSRATGDGSYAKRIHYRIGARYLQTALELKNTPLSEYAASIGFGFPVGRSYILQNFSMVNIGVEVGQRGTTTNGLIRENFLKATVGFTINDRWFQKPKFD